MLSNEFIFFSGFTLFILLVLLLDLGVFSRKNHIISFKEAAAWSAVWVALSVAFYFVIKYHGDLIHGVNTYEEVERITELYSPGEVELVPGDFEESVKRYKENMAIEYITGYLLEYTLSADNIFVMIMIFAAFGVREVYYKKVLFWGILGALVMRFIFIFVGSALVVEFHWLLWLFGAFLVYSGVKIFFDKGDEEKIEPQKHPVVRLASRFFAVYPRYVRDHFFIRRKGKLMMTPLFLVVLIIEFTDLIFAVDSVPAVFSVTKDPYVVFFSNIFAIMGLRSMFFFLSNIMHLFHYLKLGLGFLLTFIGFKMIFNEWLQEVGFKSIYSIYIILGILTVSIVSSLLFPVKPPQAVALSDQPEKVIE